MDPTQAQLQHNSGQAGAHKFQQLTFHPVEHTRMSPTLKHRGSDTYTSFFLLFIFAPSISHFSFSLLIIVFLLYHSLNYVLSFYFLSYIYLSVLTHIFLLLGNLFFWIFFLFLFIIILASYISPFGCLLKFYNILTLNYCF